MQTNPQKSKLGGHLLRRRNHQKLVHADAILFRELLNCGLQGLWQPKRECPCFCCHGPILLSASCGLMASIPNRDGGLKPVFGA